MEESNVNKINGIPNFGYGLPQNGVVIAGVTDVSQPLQELTDNNMDDEKETVEADVASEESEAETVNG